MFLRAQSGVGRELGCDHEGWECFTPFPSDGTSTSTQSPSSPVSRLPVTVKRPRRISFSSTDTTSSVGVAPFKTAKVNDHQTTGKAKVAVTQSATSRSATSRLPTASHFSADLDRASRVGDKIKLPLYPLLPLLQLLISQLEPGYKLPLTNVSLMVKTPPPTPPCLLPPPLLPPFPLCCRRMFTTCSQPLLLFPLILLQMTTTGLHLSPKKRRAGRVK